MKHRSPENPVLESGIHTDAGPQRPARPSSQGARRDRLPRFPLSYLPVHGWRQGRCFRSRYRRGNAPTSRGP